MEQEVTIHSPTNINTWTVLKASSHLTGKNVKGINQCEEPADAPCLLYLQHAVPQIEIGLISITKKSADSECQPSILLHVWEGKQETEGLVQYFNAISYFIELFFTTIFIWFLYKMATIALY